MLELDEILYQCRRGNPLAWEALVRRYQGKIYGMAFYYLKNSHEAQDVTQDIFIRIYKGLKGFRGGSDELVPWMLSVARNCCIDRIRRLKTHKKYHSAQSDTDTEAAAVNSDNPEEEIHAQQRKQLLYEALDQFNEQNREIILLKEIQGLKITDVAQILSLPIGTIKTRLMRARIELAKIISKLDPGYGERSGSSGS